MKPMDQPLLIPEPPEAVIAALVAALEKFGKHSFYCRWKDGRYDRESGCTCGLDAAIAKYKQPD